MIVYITTAYHPQSNGMIERQHRTLKDRLMARACASSSGSSTWMDNLPFVLLGLRTTVREDSLCSPSDLLYGSHLRLPGDMFLPSTPVPLASDFGKHLRLVLGSVAPMPVLHHGSKPSRVDPALESVSHVFLRVDSVRKPLVPPYDGPFPVQRRATKTFDILRNNKLVTVSIDRLKPAYVLPQTDVTPPSSSMPAPEVPPQTVQVSPPSSAAPASPAVSPDPVPVPPPPDCLVAWPSLPAPSRTAFGRVSRPVTRYQA